MPPCNYYTNTCAHTQKNLSNVGTLKKEKGPSVSWKWRSQGPQTSKTSGNSALCTSSRGLGSGMDSRSESDGHEEDEDNTLPLLHAAGDGSNGSAGRPGLEGANSDAEDIPSVGRLPLDASSGLEAQGLGEFLLVEVCALAHSFVYMAYYCIKKLVFLYLITKTG